MKQSIKGWGALHCKLISMLFFMSTDDIKCDGELGIDDKSVISFNWWFWHINFHKSLTRSLLYVSYFANALDTFNTPYVIFFYWTITNHGWVMSVSITGSIVGSLLMTQILDTYLYTNLVYSFLTNNILQTVIDVCTVRKHLGNGIYKTVLK